MKKPKTKSAQRPVQRLILPSYSANIAKMLRECRDAQRSIFDVCTDTRGPRVLGNTLNDLAKLETQLDRIYDCISAKLPRLPRWPY